MKNEVKVLKSFANPGKFMANYDKPWYLPW